MADPSPDQIRATLVRALREVERLRRQVTELQAKHEDPIAIIGIGLRLPGGIGTLDGLWDTLVSGTDLLREIPRDRWPIEGFFDPSQDVAGRSYVRNAAFVDQIDCFDAAFFGINPREAAGIDPQHRFLLEVSWEALENARIVPSTLKQSRTGVYIGIGHSDYASLQGDIQRLDAYGVTGTITSFAAGRIAYTLDLQGPALSIDTACSSSLVALHTACQGLRSGECSLALVGGVQVMAAPDTFVKLSQTHALAPDGRSKTFSDAADGYGRGEGCVVIVLERLSDARAKGHPIHALVRASAVNHDGASSGITAPNGTSQRKVIRAALESGRLAPADVDFVECHGTGTSLGDPIEVQALAAAYGEGRGPRDPLLLGAVKTSIGHLESAAGVAGIAKVITSFHHGMIPPTRHSLPLNSHVDWKGLPVEVVTSLREWPSAAGRPRRAGVSGFGLSGTNAHVILEADAPELVGPRESLPVSVPLLISGRTKKCLQDQLDKLRAWLNTHPDAELLDVGYSLATTRTHFEHRTFVAASSQVDAIREFESAWVHASTATRRGKVAFMFAGQGSQRARMGKDLAAEYPAFGQSLDEICERFEHNGVQGLRDVLFAEAGSAQSKLLDQTNYTQPALFAFEVSLARLLMAWGINPDFLIGHSIGEVAAAYVGGLWTPEDACRLVAARARLMQDTGAGGMVSIQANSAEVESVIHEFGFGVDVAATNGPMSTVISGEIEAVLACAEALKHRGRKVRSLNVSHAFHSRTMDPVLEEFRKVVASLQFGTLKTPLISNITGKAASTAELSVPEYWVRHIRNPVRFDRGIETLSDRGVNVVVEIGPRSVLSSMASACITNEEISIIQSQAAAGNEVHDLVAAIGGIHGRGVEVDWPAFFSAWPAKTLDLPTYAFQEVRSWHSSRASSPRAESFGRFQLSGRATQLPEGRFVHVIEAGPGVQGYLQDHVVYDRIVAPGAFHVAVLLAVAESHWPQQPVEIRDIDFMLALVFENEDERVDLVVELEPADRGFLVSIGTQGGSGWRSHVSAMIARSDAFEAPGVAVGDGMQWTDRRVEMDGSMRAMSIEWGPRWWWMNGMVDDSSQSSISRMSAPEGVPSDDAPMPPALIDNGFALMLRLMVDDLGETPSLPFAIKKVTWKGSGDYPRLARLRMSEKTGEGARIRSSDIGFYDAGGDAVARIEGFSVRPAPADVFLGRHEKGIDLLGLKWSEEPVSTRPEGDDVVWVGPAFDGRALTSFAELEDSVGRSLPRPKVLAVSFEAIHDDPVELCVRCLDFVRAWLASDVFGESRLTLVTSRAVAVGRGDAAVDANMTALWGLLRSVRLEFPERAISIIDMDDEASSLDVLRGCVGTSLAEVALRGGRTVVPRLQRVVHRESDRRLRSTGTVLITGASGALASAVASNLVEEHGARHLLLLSRRGEVSETLISRLRDAGCETIDVVACDASDSDSLGRVLARIPATRPLVGVVHAAGIVDDGAVSAMSSDRFARVFEAKALGARHLDQLTTDCDLDFFIVFSSVAGVLGAAGQSNYAAANAYLDGLCWQRAGRGLPAKSLAWGPWGEGGMVARLTDAERARMVAQGAVLLSRAEGLELFDAALVADETCLLLLKLDLAILAERRASAPSLLLDLLPAARRVPVAKRGPALAGASPRERLGLLCDLLLGEVSRVLGVSATDVQGSSSLQDLGLDSLMAVELRNSLQALLEVRIPVATLFEHSTVDELAAALAIQLGFAVPDVAAQVDVWRADLKLASELDFVRRRPGSPVGEVLLTGATGFIGSAILAELLETTECKIHVLVRAQNSAAAREILTAKMSEWGFPADRFDANALRVICHAGDVDKVQFGLKDDEWEGLADRIDVVISNAAKVDWIRPYMDLRATNVLGTLHALSLAAHRRPKRFVLVSSIAAAGAVEGTLLEHVGAEPPGNAGYQLSKFVAENLVRDAGERGLDFMIVRPAVVTASSSSGLVNPGQIEFQFFKACAEIGGVPNIAMNLDFTPVDVVASMIVEVALHCADAAGVLHLASPVFYSPEWLVELIRSMGGRCDVVEEDDWTKQLAAQGSRTAQLLAFWPVLTTLPKISTVRATGVLRQRELLDPTQAIALMYRVSQVRGLIALG